MKAILKVTPQDQGRYFVQGRSLVCQHGHVLKPTGELVSGSLCPKCEDGSQLEHPEYLCDVTMYGGIGKCGCQRWQYHFQPLLATLSPNQRFMVRYAGLYRCAHLEAAILFFAMEQIDRLNAGKTPTDRQHEGE